MIDLKELDKLAAYLTMNGINYQRIDEYETDIHQIVVFNEEGKRTWDVVCLRGSYGADQGLLEGMGDIFKKGKDVEGFLTAADVIERMEA